MKKSDGKTKKNRIVIWGQVCYTEKMAGTAENVPEKKGQMGMMTDGAGRDRGGSKIKMYIIRKYGVIYRL